jgi:uncharacterized heparinase superfamily protein
MLNKAGQFYRTVRHLKPVQIYGRLWFRLARPHPDPRPAPPLRAASGLWVIPARRTASLTGPTNFYLLGEAGDLETDGWDNHGREKLWRYNQHYFDDLNATLSPDRYDWHKMLIQRWIGDNVPARGSGWESYPTSLRIVNWIKWARAGNDLGGGALHSLAIQCRWLTRRLERHLLGNHLFANAKALVFAGAFFHGPEADRWLAQGIRILHREIPEQILADGGQFELSPMYHALAVEDMLDLLNILRGFDGPLMPRATALKTTILARLPAMLDWLQTMAHPDGGIAFFNDAASAIAPDNAQLVTYAQTLGMHTQHPLQTLRHLHASGYARLTAGPAILITDLARIGPDYLPGHAHADTLSFELSLFGQRVFVNSGTSLYGTGPERQRQRGTAAHNTVVVAEQNSSEVWSGFRVGRRAQVSDVRLEDRGDTLCARATHNGYHHLRGRPAHTRQWTLSQTALCVKDRLATDLPCVAMFNLHPDVRITQTTRSSGRLQLPDGQCLRWHTQAGLVQITPSTWHPQFGMSLPSSRIVVTLHSGQSQFTLIWN